MGHSCDRDFFEHCSTWKHHSIESRKDPSPSLSRLPSKRSPLPQTRPGNPFHLSVKILSLRCSRHLLPLSCRLVKVNNHEENTVSFYIDCNDDGLGSKFVHAIAESVYVSDLLQPDGSVSDSFKHFFPANDFKIIEGISKPLLAIQVTEMKDGVFISFGLPSKLLGPSQISHTDVFLVSSVDRT
ncbi:unnamed protein product [Arabidopsis lyrata]|uniref:Uncharacterized protein n=1 Tax=Arabidopsis lyrata subsp. lyrata TaxID=81972 RepID=D7LT45_ARALL|nr:hypothetical protein ARALYDRAFT_906353 [Arabidopsis lyrata subsp. lyrata]CAH8268121.1 unnamed protein product [Arabidopsis lyrata]